MASLDEFSSPERGSSQSPGKPSLRNIPSEILRYGLAVVSVALAVLATLFLQHYKFRGVALFLFAIAVTAWYAGVAPAILATVLSILCFIYFFSPPIYSFAFSLSDVPTMVILLSFAVLIIRFSTVRRRIEGHLLQARDELQVEVRERTQQASLLRRSESYLAEAQRLSRTGSWAWSSVTGEPLYWSEEMLRIFGLSPQEGVPTTERFFQRIHAEDLDRTSELLKKAAHGNMDYEHEHRIVLPDGTVKHIHAIGHPVLDNKGLVAEYVGTAMDVTDRKHAEEELHSAETRFRTSVDHLTDALFIHDDQDHQGRIIDVNQQACDSLGYTREELIGMTAFDYDAVVDTDVMLSIKERLARGEIFSFESAHRRKDGTVFPVEVRVRPFWHGDHRFGLAVVRDITDRKRSEQERERLRQLEADLARLNRVSIMGELAASLSHEIKQPIAAVGMNAKTGLRWLQREPPEAGEAQEALSRILHDAKRATDIIERNRSLYQRDTPKQEKVNLNEVVREMIALLQDAAYRQSVSIRAELDGDVPTVTADRVQMQQVLMNLMLNGIEAMKDIGGELTIRSKETEDRQILLSVSDAGVGLPGESADRVFDAFFTTKAQGTGMGLSICRRIIECHGGRLWAAANSSQGATFHFTLPTAASTSSTTA